MVTNSTRAAILSAAEAVFLEHGYSASAIAQIRQASGATTGSIYHFFGSKAGIALALWDERLAIARGFIRLKKSQTPQTRLHVMLRDFLLWGRDHAGQFRLADELQGLAMSDPSFAPIREELEAQIEDFGKTYAGWVQLELVTDMPPHIAHALIFGPATAYLRVGGKVDGDVIDAFSSAACAAIGASEEDAEAANERVANPLQIKKKKKKKSKR